MIITTALRKVRAMSARIRGVEGGTSASKTISILQTLIDLAQRDEKATTTSVISESMPHLKRGAMKDFIMILEEQGYYDDEAWNRTDFIYRFPNGSIIEFFSADQSSKVRGPRRDRLFVNEANNIDFETYEQLEIRTKQFVFLDWNPTAPFWFHEFLENRPNVEKIVLTYLDNEGLGGAIKQSIESRKDRPSWWRTFGLGLLGELKGVIMKNWRIIEEIPHEARLVRFGIDFGYTNDPSAIVAIYFWNNSYIIDELGYGTGMSNRLIADLLLDQQDKALAIADSAEPKSIAEMKGYGVNVVGAEKRKGETTSESYVKWAIGIMQQQKFWVTKNSTNVIKSFRSWVWLEDKDGHTLNEPDHEWSHAPDAVKYAVISLVISGIPNPEDRLRIEMQRRERVQGNRRDFGV